jgi:predicted AlkP superfamily pyrophosphatase or phosphodiesterase
VTHALPRRWAIAVLCAAIAVAVPRAAAPEIVRAVIISIDGLRPDLIGDTSTPRIAALMRRGAYTRSAVTVTEGYTLPSHVSMLTGVSPERHGVTWNGHIEGAYPQVPTLFALARAAGLTTALVAGKTKMIVLNRPGDLSWHDIGFEGRDPDALIAARAAAIIARHQPRVLFVHVGDVDRIGHEHGWASAEQMRAIRAADTAVGVIWDALGRRRDHTFIIITADHGGEGMAHDPENASSRRIPWIAVGPGVRQDADLAAEGVTVDTRDTFATVCAALHLKVSHDVDGSVVTAIYK